MQQNFKEVFRYIRAGYRYRFVAIILGLFVLTLVGGYSLTLPKLYKADSTVFIEKSVIDSLVRGIAVTPSIDAKVRVLKYAMLSRDLIVKTLEEIDSEIFTKTSSEQNAYIAGLQKQVQISIRGNDLFIVSLVGGKQKFVQDFVNTLVSQYVEENTSAKREEAYGANRFLDEQIQAFKGKLEQADDAITAFRREQGVFFTVDEEATLTEIKAHMTTIESLELSIDTLKMKKNQLQGQLDTLSPTVESLFSVDDGFSDMDMNPQLAAMEQRLSDLRLRYTDNYPGIARLKFEMAALKHNLENAEPIEEDEESLGAGGSRMTSLNPLYLDVQQRLLEVQSELSEAQSKKQNAQQLISKREKELREIPEAKKQLNVLLQERNSYQKVYQDLLGRMGQSEVSKQMEIGNKTATFRIVDPAIFPEIPVSPNLKKMLILAFAAGLAAAGGLIFLLENLDGKLRSPDMLIEMGVDVLAVIPNIASAAATLQVRRKNIYLVVFSLLYITCFLGVFVFYMVSN